MGEDGSHAPKRSRLRGGADTGFNSCHAACACGTKYGREKRRGWAETLPQQGVINSAALQQER